MGKNNTYVIHVGGGQERRAKQLVERIVPEDAYDEVFSPQFKKKIKRAGEWHMVDSPLVPGYLFVVTNDPQSLCESLWSVPAFTRLLDVDGSIVALDDAEMEWLERLTRSFERTVGFSEGYVVGDRVVVTSGPLVGLESDIVKIDRRKRFGYLTLRFMGRVKLLKVGLEIVSKVPAAKDEREVGDSEDDLFNG